MKFQRFFYFFYAGAQCIPAVRMLFAGLTVLLILSIDRLQRYPEAAAAAVFLLVAADLLFPAPRLFAGRPRLDEFKSVFLLVLLQGALISAGFYFSDDAVRHLFDGRYIRTGIDVYSVPPYRIGGICGLIPNHSEVPSLYFPLTQILSVAGSFLSECAGFPVLYHLLCSLCIVLILIHAGRARPFLFFLFSSPWFLIETASRHADQAGLLLIILSYFLSRAALSGGSLAALLAGAAAALVIGLKPEGTLWAFFLLFFHLRSSAAKGLPRAATFYLAAFTAVCGLMGCAVFAYWKMHPGFLDSFTATSRFFNNWFIAYNPFVLYRTRFAGYTIPAGIKSFRAELLTAGILCALVLPGSLTFLRRFRKTRRTASVMTALFFLVSSVWLFSKGSWQPWYFAWWLCAAVGAGFYKPAIEIIRFLPLCYVPIAFFRYDSTMPYGLFFLLLGILVFCRIFLTFQRSKKMLQWSRENGGDRRNIESGP